MSSANSHAQYDLHIGIGVKIWGPIIHSRIR